MYANYHTHTPLCQHAVGDEKEYIEAAIKNKFSVLGFSDHVPQPYPDGIVSGIRMRVDQLDDYVSTLEKLRKEYQFDIDIKIGFETEYTPHYHEKLMQILSDYPIDYLIQGQHFVDDEFDGFYSGAPTTSEDDLKAYVDLTIQGMETGVFSYLAHPDLINYQGPSDIYRKHMRRICRKANELQLPLEVNMLGFQTGRHYPCDTFFQLAVSEGCRFILGCDAHDPRQVIQPEMVPGFLDFLSYNKIIYSQDLTLRPIH
ncbi:MAG: histidinol-phosphatase [Lachnospiraceae bacterium]|nr:histidinol-phosphatase [Lachnospiraceae bacterium]